MKDYKNFEPNKYPEPADRKSAKDFPDKSELFVYGVDIPVPKTEDELRCEYRMEGSGLTLADLDGYRVPPLGLKFVTKLGGGYGYGWGFIYGMNTFFENVYGIDKPLGKTQPEMMLARVQVRRDAEVAGYVKRLEEEGFDILGSEQGLDVETTRALAYLALDFIISDKSGKEMRQLFNDFCKRQAHKAEMVDRHSGVEEVAKMGKAGYEAIDKAYELLEKEREKLEAYESVDVTVTDIDDDDDDLQEGAVAVKS